MVDKKPIPLRQFVTFRIDGDLFGFDIRIVKEVNPTADIACVPLAPEKIRGVVNIRGQIVLVIDIAVLFNRPERPVTDQTQLVIIKTRQELGLLRDAGDLDPEMNWGDKPVAFLVDSIGDVLTVASAAVERAPSHIPERIAAYLDGVARIEDELLILLDAGRLSAPGPAESGPEQRSPTGRSDS